MKSKLNPIPAAKRTEEILNDHIHDNDIILKRDEAQKLVTGIYELDAKVKLKDTQIVTITKQKSDLQQLVTVKTSEVQSKNSLLSQKEQLLIQKEQLLSELRIREENQLKEEYISVLHQLNPKVYSANYEDWTGKAQGAKNLIDQGNFTKIKKNLVGNKQQLAQKIETEKLALATKEAEKLDKEKEEAVSILHQLHPHSYPVNYEDWPTHIKARKLLDSGNLQAIEKNLVVYRELLKKELARQKEEVQNKDQLILQKEQEFKSLNDTFTTTISTKEEEIITKSQLLSQTTTKVKKVSRKLAQEVQSKNQLALQKEMEEKLRIEKEQEIERLRELIAQKDIEIQNTGLLVGHKDELLAQKEEAVHNKSAEKNRIIEELTSSLLTREEEISTKNLNIGELSHKVKKTYRKAVAKDKEIEALKVLIEQARIEKEEVIAKQELALANKSHMKNQIIDELEEELGLKEDEVGNLRIQNLEKELMTQEQEKLLAEQDIRLQNLLDFNAKLDAKMQYSAKEIKIREAEKEILSKMIAQKHETLKVLLVQKESEVNEKSFEKNQLIKELREEIEGLNKQIWEHNHHITQSILLGEVSCQVGDSLLEKQILESLNLSSINLSPINHGEQNQIVGNILGNFDIDNQHITTSVVLGGEGSDSFSIIQDDGSH